MEFDHITPHSKGAPATVDNIQLLCRKCNIAKGDKTDHCPHCGNWLPHDATFCHSCGERLPNLARQQKDYSGSSLLEGTSKRQLKIIAWLLMGIGMFLLISMLLVMLMVHS
jgi:predicted nucleic acid-binding Zn ribbon protein